MGVFGNEVDPFVSFVLNKSYENLPKTERMHLTPAEKRVIDNNVIRLVETNRRIETKIMKLNRIKRIYLIS
jgi:hypothetical protein